MSRMVNAAFISDEFTYEVEADESDDFSTPFDDDIEDWKWDGIDYLEYVYGQR